MKRFKPISAKKAIEIAYVSLIVLLIVFIVVASISCATEKHFAQREEITITCFYSGQLINITQATKKHLW